MASSQLDMDDALHGRREIRALLDDRRSDQRLIRSALIRAKSGAKKPTAPKVRRLVVALF
jgi:hypothetical protein